MTPTTSFPEAFAPMRRFTQGWEAFKRFLPVLFVGGCLKGCTQGGGASNMGTRMDSGSSPFFEALRDGGDPFRALGSEANDLLGGIGIAVVIAVGLVLMLLLIAYASWIIPGWIKLHRSVLVEGRGDFDALFSGGSHFVPMFGWILLEGCVWVGTALVGVVPGVLVAWAGGWGTSVLFGGLLAFLISLPIGIYVGLGLSFGAHVVTLEDRGAVDALTRSWELVDGHRFDLFVFRIGMVLVQVGAAILGVCLFCIGGLFTQPTALAITDLAFTEGFLRYTRPAGEPDTWASSAWAAGVQGTTKLPGPS